MTKTSTLSTYNLLSTKIIIIILNYKSPEVKIGKIGFDDTKTFLRKNLQYILSGYT